MNDVINLAAPTDGHACATGVAAELTLRGSTVDGLIHAARSLASAPEAVAAWLDEVRNGPVAAMARRSYWHPNGFAKLVLHINGDPEFRIRLHVWPEVDGPPLGESNPHSHRWDFASTVVAGGGLHMVEYVETQRGGKPYDRYRYGADPANPAALLRAGGARLTRTSSPHVRFGGVYSCDIDVVHTVVPIRSGLTATLVVQGPHRSPATRVYRPPGTGAEQPNRELSEEDFKLLLKNVATRMREQVGR